VADQTHSEVEIAIVNDGSFRDQDRIVFELADRFGATVVTQANSGLGAARNLGIAQSRGRYVLPLDADDMIDPSFIERCVAALERDPELAYVTSWVRYVDRDGRPVPGEEAGYMPLGNWSALIERHNVGGTCSAVLRRSLFEGGFSYSVDLTSYEDWLLYMQLYEAGHYGAVIPERLITYRVRGESMMRTLGEPRLRRLAAEIRAHRLEADVHWTPAELPPR
jgi:glycogen synthase